MGKTTTKNGFATIMKEHRGKIIIAVVVIIVAMVVYSVYSYTAAKKKEDNAKLGGGGSSGTTTRSITTTNTSAPITTTNTSAPICLADTKHDGNFVNKCKFPFTYYGREFNACTTYDGPNNPPYSVPWCSFSSTADIGAYWGVCSAACPREVNLTTRPTA